MEQQKYTRQQFASKIKEKYPAYAEMDDNTLVDKITAKYPQYLDQIEGGKTNAVAEETATVAADQQSELDLQSENGLSEQPIIEEPRNWFEENIGDDLPVIEYFSDAWRDIKRGAARGQTTDESSGIFFGDKSEEGINNYVNALKGVSNLPQSEEMQKYQKYLNEYKEQGDSDSLAWFKAQAKSTVKGEGVLQGMLLESLASQASTIFASPEQAAAVGATAAATGAASAGIGAAATSWSGPFAAIAAGFTGTGGAIAGARSGSMMILETTSTFNDLLAEEITKTGGDPLNKEDIKKVLEDESKMDSLRRRSLAAGATISAFELASGMVGTSVAAKPVLSKAAKAVRAAKVAGVEAAGGGFGEIAGRTASGQEIKAEDVLTEAFTGVGMSAIDIASASVSKKGLAEYSLNGEKKTKVKAEIEDLVDNGTDEEFANIKVKVSNDPALNDKIQKRRKKIIKENKQVLKEKIQPQKATDLKKRIEAEIKKTELEVEEIRKVDGDTVAEAAQTRVKELKQQLQDLDNHINYQLDELSEEETLSLMNMDDDVSLYQSIINDPNSTDAAKKSAKSELARLKNNQVEVLNNTDSADLANPEGPNKQKNVDLSQKTQDAYEKGGKNAWGEIAQHQVGTVKSIATSLWSRIPEDKKVGTYDDFVAGIISEPGGLKDMVASYKPELGVPLAAYLGDRKKGLRARANRIVKKFTKQDIQSGLDSKEAMSTFAEGIDIDAIDLGPEFLYQKLGLSKILGDLTNDVEIALTKTEGELSKLGEVTQKKRQSTAEKAFNSVFTNKYDKKIKEFIGKNTKNDDSFSKFIKNNFTTLRKIALSNIDFQKGSGMSRTWNQYAPNLEDFLDYYEGKDITPEQPSSTKNDRKNKLVKAIEAQLAKDARESYFRERPTERAEFNEQQQISFQEALIEREPNIPGEFTPESTAYKAIFMVGSPGGGKTNVGKGLQLGRRGYKVVNQDIALEALKKAAGLPENESNYTKEQRSLRSKLGMKAVKAGKDKFQQYKNEGKGFLVDGTGASYNATTKKIKELEAAGYEVYLVAAMTPKDVAIERNKARKERSLPTFVVSKSYDQVVKSLAKYKEDYGDRVFEIDTTTIGFGEALPQDFLNEVYNGITQTKVKQIPDTNPIIAFQEALPQSFARSINEKIESELDRVFGLYDETGAAGANVLLNNGFTADDIVKLRTEDDVKTFINEVLPNILPLMPKDGWKSILLNSDRIIDIPESRKAERKALYNDVYRPLIEELLESEDTVFGDNIEGVDKLSFSPYKTAFGTTPEQIKAKNDSGKIKEINDKNVAAWREIWIRTANILNQENGTQYAPALEWWYRLSINNGKHPHRMGAEMVGWSKNPKGHNGKFYDWEHAMPSTGAYAYLLDSALKGERDFLQDLQAVQDNYKLIALDAADHRNLNTTYLKAKMPIGWKVFSDSWLQRYFNEMLVKKFGGIDSDSIVLLNGKTIKEEFNIGTSGVLATLEQIESNKDKTSDAIQSAIEFQEANSPDPELTNNERVEALTDLLNSVYGTKATRSKQEAIDYLVSIGFKEETAKSAVEQKGFRVPGLIYVNEQLAGVDTPMHEFTHEWAELVNKRDPELFNAIYEKLKSHPRFEEATKRMANSKIYSQYSPDSFEYKNEVMAHILGEEGKSLYEIFEGDAEAKTLIDKFFDYIKEALGFDPATKNFADLTVDEVIKLAVKDISEGNPAANFNKLKNVAEGKSWFAKSEAAASPSAKAKADPILRALNKLKLSYRENKNLAQAINDAYSEVEGIMDFLDFARLIAKNTKEITTGKTKQLLVAKAEVIKANKIAEESAKKQAEAKVSEDYATELQNKFRRLIYIATAQGAKPSKWFIPPNAEDIKGLLYAFLPKGRRGVEARKWMEETILKPYSDAIAALDTEILHKSKAWAAMSKGFDFNQKVDGSPYTLGDAIKVYNALKEGKDPGIAKKKHLDALIHAVESNSEILDLANETADSFPIDLKSGWQNRSFAKEIYDSINDGARKRHLETFSANVDAIFNDTTLDLIADQFGVKYRQALVNTLKRMKSGRNRTANDANANAYMNWLNRAVGTTMFLNTRSAVLQLLSTLNFIGKPGNNLFQATAAFANRKQWNEDYKKLWDSDYLTNRRDGAKFDVLADEIANDPDNWISKILQKGFLPTRYADSFAIALGGASFYRNRVNSLVKEGMSEADAEVQAMKDWRQAAEESQQSSDPSKISEIQASSIGKIIYAFANTPFQYARITKRKLQDLTSGRSAAEGSVQKDLGTIFYYSMAQALIFNALQSGLVALLMSDDEDDEELKEEKYASMLERSLTSFAKSTGNPGAVASTLYAMMKEGYLQQTGKKRPDANAFAVTATSISPPLNSKLRDIAGAYRAYNKIEDGDAFTPSLDNEALTMAGEVASVAGLPLDRVIRKARHLAAISNEEAELWQKIWMLAGWSEWELGVDKPNVGVKKPKIKKVKITKPKLVKPKLKKSPTKKLERGVAGRANNDGTIEIDPNLSPVEREKTVAHEEQHMKDMKAGKLNYDDNYVYWNDSKYERKNGKIKYKGKSYIEGHKDLPWEKVAYNAEPSTAQAKKRIKLYA